MGFIGENLGRAKGLRFFFNLKINKNLAAWVCFLLLCGQEWIIQLD
jgi:hypothetical protein